MDQTVATDLERKSIPWSTDQVKAAVQAFLRDFSIEATPHARRELDTYPDFLAPGTTIYVAHPPRASLPEVVDLACKLQAMGYEAVPHIAVRRIESEAQINHALVTLRSAGIDQALIVGGDSPEPAGPYVSTMQLLETGLLPMYDFNTIGIAGHPEGSRAIGPTMLRNALQEKVQFGAETALRMYIVTQFGFNPDAVVEWEASIRAGGIDLPIHVGMAGLVPLKELLRYAVRCGISASMRMLLSRTSALADQAKLTSMDELVLAFACHRLANPDTRLTRAHFFAFGGARRTAHWLNTVLDGKFSIDLEGRRIELEQ